MGDVEYVNEEEGVPAVRDGIPQDPNNHNGPKLTDEERRAAAMSGEDVEKETPEAPRQRGKASGKPETR